MGFWSKLFGGGEPDTGPIPDFPEDYHAALLAVAVSYLDGKPVGTTTAGKYAEVFKDALPQLEKEAKKKGLLEVAAPQDALRGMKASELKNILKAHGLSVSGKKDDLTARIVASVPLEDYAGAVPTINIATARGREMLDRWFLLVERGRGLDEEMFDFWCGIARELGRALTKSDAPAILRAGYWRVCERDLRAKNWESLFVYYGVLAYMYGRKDLPERDILQAVRCELMEICLNLSGMGNDNEVRPTYQVCIGFTQNEYIRTGGVPDDTIMLEARAAADKVVALVPFSYFTAEDMVTIIGDMLAARAEDWPVYDNPKYDPMWARPKKGKGYRYHNVEENGNRYRERMKAWKDAGK